MRGALRGILEHHAGTAGRALLAWRTRAQAERLLERRGGARVAADLASRLGDTVAAGPFRGMRYPRRFGDIVHVAKLVGGYECELHEAIERLITRAPALIVNVGSGDGYYAVGLARRIERAVSYAVDPDPLAQRACRETAQLNGVGRRLRHLVRVDAAAFERLLAGFDGSGRSPVLAVVDCEGFEDDLLDPSRAPALRRTDVLVETHDSARPGVTARLMERFAPTHRIERIEVANRDPSRFPSLEGVAPATAAALLEEYRHFPQSWLVMTAIEPRLP